MRTNNIHSLWINQNSTIMEDQRYLMINTRGVFRTDDGASLRKFLTFFSRLAKKAPLLDLFLNTPLNTIKNVFSDISKANLMTF